MTPKRRFPLWLTLVPVAFGGAVYWQVWSGYRTALRSDIAHFLPGAPVTIGGFPYRMEATVAGPRLVLGGPVRVTLAAGSALVNRAPWKRDLTVIRTANPVAEVSVPLTGVTAQLTAATGVSSLHLAATGVARQSNVFMAAHLVTGVFAAPVGAKSFEVHLRETRARSNEAWSPTPPQQAEVVLAGTDIRIGGGAPLTLAADFGVTATARLRDFAGWSDGGTVEVRSLTLADASGEVLRLTASAVPLSGRLRLAGTIMTVCPATVAAAFAAAIPPRELRLRTPVRLAFGGFPNAFVVAAPTGGPPLPVRGQVAPCPRLR